MLSSFKFQQFINLTTNQGFKKALQTARDYPAMLVLPAFSVWTYGSMEKVSCQNCQISRQKIGLSYNNTFLNSFYTLFVVVSVTTLTVSAIGYENFVRVGLNEDTFSFFLALPVFLVSIILMSFVACMDTCSCCSCSCCCNYLLPMIERTTFNLQQETGTEIGLVEINLASINVETTAPQTASDKTTIEIQEGAIETTPLPV